MVQINNLSSTTSLAGGDLLPVYSSSVGDTRKASLSTFLAFVRANLASPDFTTEIVAPTSSGFNIQLAAQTSNLWLIINPTGAFAAGTVTLPPVAGCYDGQVIQVSVTNDVTALTVNGNGGTVLGAPSTLPATGFFALRFNLLQQTWYTVANTSPDDISIGGDLSVTGNGTFGGLVNAVGNIATAASVVVGTNIVMLSDGDILDSNENEILEFLSTASAVNNIEIANSATGSGPAVRAKGSDTNIDIKLTPKGTGKVSTSAPIVGGSYIATGFTTFSSLPSAATAGKGARHYITDCNTATFNAVAAGGGGNSVPVVSDGSDWRVG